MENFLVRPLFEADMEAIIRSAGGERAHPDADRHDLKSADFLLGDAVVELKALDEEGLVKSIRQRHLAELFRPFDPQKPVIVIDRDRLPHHKHKEFDRIIQGPIKSAVASARKQLKQSRREYSTAVTSILLIINNGYSALDHDSLRDLVARRVRNDTSEIDGIVVGGCYFHSDGFDSFFLWPLEYVAINSQRSFSSYARLREAWDRYANEFMTAVVRGDAAAKFGKGPVADLCFDHDGVTYVRPAPPLGNASSFFVAGRPRRDTTALDSCPPVATTFPDMTESEWLSFRANVPDDPALFTTYERWLAERSQAASVGTELCPFVLIAVTYTGWRNWVQSQADDSSISRYANDLFEEKIRQLIASARDWDAAPIKPPRYVLAVTELIGQDRANDVSHIALVRERLHEKPATKMLAVNLRIFHDHGVALAAAYALTQKVELVMWSKDLRYGWV